MESLMTQLIYELEIKQGLEKSGLFGVTSWKAQGRVQYYKGAYLFINFILFSYYFFC